MRFTKENASDFGKKGNIARWSRPKLDAITPANPGPITEDNSYISQRIARVRAMLDRLDALLDRERDPQALDRLASAYAKLADQERILSGRPLPGSRRPKPEREPKAQPTVLEPQIPTELHPVGQDTQTN